MNGQLRRYMAAVGWPTVAYLVSALAAALLTKHMAPGWLRAMVAILPLPSILWLAHAELLRLRRHDELRQRIELEAMTTAFSVSFCLVVMLTFLDLFGVIKVDIVAVAMLMVVCWIGAHIWVRTRYYYSCLQADKEANP